MKRVQSSLFLFLLLLIIPSCVNAQAWTGIIDPSRAVDWSQAGAHIVEPTNQCGTTIAPEGTLASPVVPTNISNAIAACTGGGYVQLGSGTFYLSKGWGFWNGNGWNSHVVVRGQGANSTFIYFVGGSVGGGNNNSAIALEGSGVSTISEQNGCNWIADYSKGATNIQLANCGSTTPAIGSVSNLAVGTLLVLDQVDLTADNGTTWNCAVNFTCAGSGTGGIIRTDGTCTAGGPSPCARSQSQGVVVTSITTTGGSCTASSPCLGITPGLYMPTWTTVQKPQAWFGTRFITGDGLENMSLDATHATGLGQIIEIENCYGCWVSGVRTIASPRDHVLMSYVWHSVVKDNYFYASLTAGAGSYSVELDYTWDSLVQNNICQQVTDSCPGMDSATEGNVSAYNFGINNIYTASTGYMQYSFYHHDSGDALNLSEGNIQTGENADDIHGTHLFDTDLRNYYIGQQASGCNGAVCSSQATPVEDMAGTRYFNHVGNVLGMPGFHTTYTCVATSTSACPSSTGFRSIYNLGFTRTNGNPDTVTPRTGFCNNVACATPGNFDGLVGPYLMRWGNYDVVNAAVQWNSGEVPTALASYSNAVPASHTLPSSFYLPAKPAWWGSLPYPALGPDVTSGNLGLISGGTYDVYGVGAIGTSTSTNGGGTFTANVMAGHANENPAMRCALEVMGIPVDGTGSVLSFNANTCYSGGAPIPTTPTGKLPELLIVGAPILFSPAI